MRCAALLFALGIAGCTPSRPQVYMPPAEYDHPFVGTLVLHEARWNGDKNKPLSQASTDYLRDGFYGRPLRCDIYLPRIGDPGIDVEMRDKLLRIETANCNGGWRADVNGRHFQ